MMKRIRSHLYDALLFCNVFILTPMWLMLICLAIYFYLLYWSLHFWKASPIPLTLLLLYGLHILTDRRGPEGHFARTHPQWTSYLRSGPGFVRTAQYFPVTLHPTVALPPEQGPYLFLYHPHGVIGMGSNAALNTNGCDFERVFPGIVRYGVTLPIAFSVPFIRDFMIALGYVHSHRRTLERILSQQKESVVLVPGGAPEALDAKPGTFRCRSKTAPLRLALATGATIVPCLGFGENDAFDVYTPAAGRLRQFQHWLCRVCSFSTPILRSPCPQRRPIAVVVGAPLRLTSSDGSAYRAAVEQLYNEHKGRFGHADIPLEWLPSPSSTSHHHQRPG